MEDNRIISAQEFCYEYFDCSELDCSRRKKPELNCCEIEDVNCKSYSPEFGKLRQRFGSKLEACKLCIYYQRNVNSSLFYNSYACKLFQKRSL